MCMYTHTVHIQCLPRVSQTQQSTILGPRGNLSRVVWIIWACFRQPISKRDTTKTALMEGGGCCLGWAVLLVAL